MKPQPQALFEQLSATNLSQDLSSSDADTSPMKYDRYIVRLLATVVHAFQNCVYSAIAEQNRENSVIESFIQRKLDQLMVAFMQPPG